MAHTCPAKGFNHLPPLPGEFLVTARPNSLCVKVDLALGEWTLLLTPPCYTVWLDLSLISSSFPVWFIFFFMLSQMHLMIMLIANSIFLLVRMKFQRNKVQLVIHHLHTH